MQRPEDMTDRELAVWLATHPAQRTLTLGQALATLLQMAKTYDIPSAVAQTPGQQAHRAGFLANWARYHGVNLEQVVGRLPVTPGPLEQAATSEEGGGDGA